MVVAYVLSKDPFVSRRKVFDFWLHLWHSDGVFCLIAFRALVYFGEDKSSGILVRKAVHMPRPAIGGTMSIFGCKSHLLSILSDFLHTCIYCVHNANCGLTQTVLIFFSGGDGKETRNLGNACVKLNFSYEDKMCPQPNV